MRETLLRFTHWEELTKDIHRRVADSRYYPKNIDLVPQLLEMNVTTRDDVVQEWLTVILSQVNKELNMLEAPQYSIISILNNLELAYSNEDNQQLNQSVKLLLRSSGFGLINALSRKSGSCQVIEYEREAVQYSDRQNMTLKHVLYEYGLDKESATTQKAIFKRIYKETLTDNERVALNRLKKKFTI